MHDHLATMRTHEQRRPLATHALRGEHEHRCNNPLQQRAWRGWASVLELRMPHPFESIPPAVATIVAVAPHVIRGHSTTETHDQRQTELLAFTEKLTQVFIQAFISARPAV